MDHVPAESVQVNTLAHHRAADQYLREQWTVEGLSKTIPGLGWSFPEHHPHERHYSITAIVFIGIPDVITVNIRTPSGAGVNRNGPNQLLKWVICLIISFVGTRLTFSLCPFRLFDRILKELQQSGHDGLAGLISGFLDATT
jgi:uncharacterized membrane protein YfcA